MDAQSHLQVEVEQLVRIHGRNRTALMPVLQELNRAHSYISEDAMLCVAKELNVPRAEVYGVATFYSFLSVKPRGKFVVRMCRTISCAKQGNFIKSSPACLMSSAFGSARPRATGISRLNKPTATACAIKAQPCW